MKKLILVLAFLLPNAVFAAGGGVHLDTANYDLTDKASLQNGAKLFQNYCLGFTKCSTNAISVRLPI